MTPEWIEDIRRDNLSGAATLARRAAQAFQAWLAQGRTAEETAEAAVALVRAQPRMAPLVNLACRVLAAGAEAARACQEFLSAVEQAAVAVAQHGAALLSDGDTVLTHSFSSVVRGALLEAVRRGRRFRVIATESRPMREGVRLARELADAGIPVQLVVDAAAPGLAPEVTRVMVGADAVTLTGVVNKVGTAPLALAAREHHVPIHVLASSDKFLPAGYRLPPEPPHDPREILEEETPRVTVRNLYFEIVPLDWFTAVVSEEGSLPPGEVRARLQRAAYPAVLQRLAN